MILCEPSWGEKTFRAVLAEGTQLPFGQTAALPFSRCTCISLPLSYDSRGGDASIIGILCGLQAFPGKKELWPSGIPALRSQYKPFVSLKSNFAIDLLQVASDRHLIILVKCGIDLKEIIAPVCTDCGTRFLRSRNCSENDAFPVCPDCYNRNYTHCTRCGALIHTNACYYPYDNDDPYCQSCCREIDSCAIHEYGYKPEAIFYGQGDRFFGVELEIDGGGEYTDNAESILSIANREQNLIYCKHDGSLDDGFEIVTHPMSLDFQLHKMPWQAVLQRAIAMGYLSHQAGTCGLHVHVSRDAFGDTGDAQDKAIARVLFFVERHWNELLRFSRRSQHQMDRWAARYGYRDHPDEMLEHIKKGYGNRYTCVNLTNENTVEFRMFRGTLKWNTLIATLQMVNRICDAAIYLPDEELRSLSWSSFVSGITEPELIQYLKERDLYINEPTEGEVEF